MPLDGPDLLFNLRYAWVGDVARYFFKGGMEMSFINFVAEGTVLIPYAPKLGHQCTMINFHQISFLNLYFHKKFSFPLQDKHHQVFPSQTVNSKKFPHCLMNRQD